jgi:hypothetical protein
MEQLATRLLINEINRRLNIINSETTELREQMIIDLSKDLERFEDYEKDAFERYKIEFLKEIIEDAQQVHSEYIVEQLKNKLKDYEFGI